MKVYPDTKIYIICPGKYNSGGPESLHQLCSKLIEFGLDANILYIQGHIPFTKDDPVHDDYKKYHVPYAFDLADASHNILIVPEYFTEYLYITENIQRVLWWMSVNNYLKAISSKINAHAENVTKLPVPKFFYFQEDNIEHWAKAEYPRLFLKANGIPAQKIHHVETYMNRIFFKRAAQIGLAEKKNIVAYNHKKGFEITQQLIKLAPDIAWKPIKNMSPAQVQNLLAQAKVYIDFGEHPGRDRLPREATISGCVVITGRRGAAANNVDINIPDEFKFDEKTSTPLEVVEKIREVFRNFPAAHAKQNAYRARVLEEPKQFTAQAADAFGIKNLPPPTVAFVQGIGEKSFLMAQELFQSAEFWPRFIVDDVLATTNISDKLILREQNRNYLRVGEDFVEIITRDDAKFLYHEGRIKIFALLNPIDNELAELKNFYEAAAEDILIYELDG